MERTLANALDVVMADVRATGTVEPDIVDDDWAVEENYGSA